MISPVTSAGSSPMDDHENEKKQFTSSETPDDDVATLQEGERDGDGSSSTASELEPSRTSQSIISKYEGSWLYKILTPRRCRWNPKAPPQLTMFLCILYALSSTFTAANLYYNQPILNKIAHHFHVTYEESSQVATMVQAGYAAGLIFILPLGDLVERRPFIISLITFTATLWIGLCLTDNFTVFRALTFICGITNVTPQLMIPLVGDYAPAHRKTASLSIVISGLMLGMVFGRFLAGVVSNFTNWRNIYWVACGSQYLLATALFCFMPDYPSTNPDGLNYLQALWSIPYMMVTEVVLIQCCLVIFCLSAVFTSFWTTLTFLLASSPFDYSSLQIGLFSLLTMVTMVIIPFIGRLIDRFVPLFSILIGQTISMIGAMIGTTIGTFTVAGPIIQGISIDIGVQTCQVANRAAIFAINPKARNRVNTAYMATAFAGQLTGTAVGNKLYAGGGWRWSGGCSIAFIGMSLLATIARGPRETRWLGWRGGWMPRKDKAVTSSTVTVDPELQPAEQVSQTRFTS